MPKSNTGIIAIAIKYIIYHSLSKIQVKSEFHHENHPNPPIQGAKIHGGASLVCV